MIAASRKKIIKMTQGERLFNVILIISVSWQAVVKSFRYMEQAEARQIEKIGILLFQHLVLLERSGTVLERSNPHEH